MRTRAIAKNHRLTAPLYRIKKDISAWEGILGIWKGKRMPNPVEWQRKIRKEWERKLT